MKNKYGDLPQNLGVFNIQPDEMMYYMYMPIKLNYSNDFFIEDRLNIFLPLLEKVKQNLSIKDFFNNYIYDFVDGITVCVYVFVLLFVLLILLLLLLPIILFVVATIAAGNILKSEAGDAAFNF